MRTNYFRGLNNNNNTAKIDDTQINKCGLYGDRESKEY